jgi:hypothetical protein
MITNLNDTMPSVKAPGFPRHDGDLGASAAPSTAGQPPGAAAAPTALKKSYTLMDGVKLVSGIITVARALGPVARMLRSSAPPSALAIFGLARRRSPLAKLAIFGLGLAVGIGAGLILTPATGFDLRRKLVIGTKKKGRRNRGKDAEGRMASWVSERTASIQDARPAPAPTPTPAPTTRVDPLAETLRDVSRTAARVGAVPPDHEHAAVAGTEAAVPPRGQTIGTPGYRFG